MSAACAIEFPRVLPSATQNPSEVPDQVRHEHTLITAILRGDTERFAELVRPYKDRIFSKALSILDNNHEDAEECIQESLLKALRHLSSFRGNSRFNTWLTQIAMNEALMRRRLYRRSRYDSLDAEHATAEGETFHLEATEQRVDQAETLEANMVRQALLHAITALPASYREVIELRDLDELSIAETGKLLGLTEPAVKTRHRRARMQLRQMLEPHWGKYWQDCFSTRKPAKVM